MLKCSSGQRSVAWANGLWKSTRDVGTSLSRVLENTEPHKSGARIPPPALRHREPGDQLTVNFLPLPHAAAAIRKRSLHCSSIDRKRLGRARAASWGWVKDRYAGCACRLDVGDWHGCGQRRAADVLRSEFRSIPLNNRGGNIVSASSGEGESGATVRRRTR